jgi:hypothetical protein
MALSTECFLISEELAAQAIPTSIRSLQERAKRLNDVGTKFQTNIGNNTLFLPELFSNYSDTGIRRALRLFAESQENLAEATVYFDPKKAAEYYQNAANYRQQIGDADNVQKNLARVGQYSKSVSCWFCQREITGEQVHFFAMDSDLTTLVRETKTDGSPLPSTHQSQDLIYACRGCHSAISKKADEIALAYHVVALAKMNEINIHLQRQINELYRMAHRH